VKFFKDFPALAIKKTGRTILYPEPEKIISTQSYTIFCCAKGNIKTFSCQYNKK
jgi:hypothetical protein